VGGVVASFAHRLLAGEQPIINGDGGQTRDYVYVGDVARANLLALEHDTSDTINIGTGIETDVVTLFSVLNELTEARLKPVFGEASAGEQRRSVIDSSKARRCLNWEPRVSLSEGLQNCVQFFRRNEQKNEKST